MRERLIDVTVRRGVAGGISDNFLAECNVKRCARKKKEKGRCITEIVKVSEFEKQKIRDAYRLLIAVEWFSVKDAMLLSAEEKFKSFIFGSAGEVRKVNGGMMT